MLKQLLSDTAVSNLMLMCYPHHQVSDPKKAHEDNSYRVDKAGDPERWNLY